MPDVTVVGRLDDAWRDLRRRRPDITGCRVYGRRHASDVPAPGDGPALQVNAPLGQGTRVHKRFAASLAASGIGPFAVSLVELLGVATGFGSAGRTRWEPPVDDRYAGSRPVVSSRQIGMVLRFASAGEAAAAWTELERWRPAYGQTILDRSLHLEGDPGVRPAVAPVSEHQLLDAAGRRLVYLAPEPPRSPGGGAWVAASSDRFEFHQYLRWTAPHPPPRIAPTAGVVAGEGR